LFNEFLIQKHKAMITEYLESDNNQDNDQSNKNDNPAAGQKKNAIGKSEESNKKKHFNVLHKDGSLADLPDKNVAGTGALDGTVGLGQ
jgi:hypothetical protein